MSAALKSLEDPSVDVRRVGLRTLAHVSSPGNASAVESAATLLVDKAWPVRWAAIDAVAWLAQGGSCSTVVRAIEVLTVRLEDVDWPVRMAAAIGLSNLVQFLAAISKEIEADSPPNMQEVGKIEDVRDQIHLLLNPVSKLLKDPSKEVKQEALKLLPLVCENNQATPAVTRALCRIAEDSLPLDLRCEAIALLHHFGAGEQTLQQIRQKAIHDPGLQVLVQAVDGLKSEKELRRDGIEIYRNERSDVFSVYLMSGLGSFQQVFDSSR